MRRKKFKISVSIVLFESKATEIKGLISSLLSCHLGIKIYLIDNSATDVLKRLANDDRIEYIFNNKNLGYGKGHNIGIFKSINEGALYHLIINPDVELEGFILDRMHRYLEENPDIGCLVPKVVYPGGKVQHLNKLYPTPFDLIVRRFLPNKLASLIPRLNRYELSYPNNDPHPVPIASGCFMFCRNDILKRINGFDPRYFMYLEDTDMCRRINRVSKVVYYPDVQVIHTYAKGSYTNPRLLFYHVISAIKYFNKWGWLLDLERRRINKQYL